MKKMPPAVGATWRTFNQPPAAHPRGNPLADADTAGTLPSDDGSAEPAPTLEAANDTEPAVELPVTGTE
jgi:hypothetical protein